MNTTLKLSDGHLHAIIEARDHLRRALSLGEREGRSQSQIISSWRTDFNSGLYLSHLSSVIGQIKSDSTLRKWLNAADAESLRPRYGNRRGQSKATTDEQEALLRVALHPNRLRKSQAVRLARMALRSKGVPSPSSDRTLVRWLNGWIKANYDKWVFAREGSKALNDKCLPFLCRNAELLEVGQVLIADGHKLNFQILHPFTGKPCRMNMVLWYDWASRWPCGFEIMPNENVQAVASSLRKAILNLGKIPQVAYLDNGKAFKAKIFTDESIDFEEAGFYGMFARLGIETVFAWPYNAQSKPVERFFGTFSEVERLMPTFTGTSIQDKPAHMLRNEQLHRAVHLKKYNGWVPTIEEARVIIEGWLAEYGQRPHSGLKGLCPLDVSESGKGPGVDPESLRHLMMAMEVHTVTRKGISFMTRDYYDPALYGLRNTVLIKYDLSDLSQILVFDETGRRFICRAEVRQAVHPIAAIAGTSDDLEAVKEGIRLKRSLKRQTEAAARAYVMDAPALVQIPEVTGGIVQGRNGKAIKVISLPQGEAEHIEAEAARMRVVPVKPKEQPIFSNEVDRYEWCLKHECVEQVLGPDDVTFMRYFEKTKMFTRFQTRFEFLREQWTAESGGLADEKYVC
jgi:putative transposase